MKSWRAYAFRPFSEMPSPVYFQRLEQELAPVTSFLRGNVLDAGCGQRDIGPYLLKNAATHLTRYDIRSDDSKVIVGPIEMMPFANATFDAVLCNAVLEHVPDVHEALGELVRVVKPGGYIVVALPFLQPAHGCPGDYRRFTADGLSDLGRGAGLEVVKILSAHSIVQTIGWIVWEYALEKRGWLYRSLAWPIVFLVTRLRYRSDPMLVRSANTFQAVFRRSSHVAGNETKNSE